MDTMAKTFWASLLVLLCAGLVVAMNVQAAQPDAGRLAAVAVGVVIGALAVVDTKRRRGRSRKQNDKRTCAKPRVTSEEYPPLRVRMNNSGELECVLDEEDITGTLVISAFHFIAYFYAAQIAQFDENTTAAMEATAVVHKQMTNAARESSLGRNSGVSYWHRITAWAAFENWALVRLGQTDPLRMKIVSLHEAAARYKSSLAQEEYAEEPSQYPVPSFDIDFSIVAQVITYCDYLYLSEDADLDSRGLSFVSVRGFQTAVSELFSSFNKPSPFTEDKRLSGKVQAWRRAYVANNPTKTLPDLASTLPLLHEACMSMSGWNAPKRQQSWTMILFRLNHGLRASSLSQFCPETIRLPPSSQEFYDLDGFPKLLAIKYDKWKGKKPAEPPRWLFIFRNVYCAKYCIVVNLLLTLNITGWNKVGPLFGNLDADGRLIVADHTENVQVDTQIQKVWVSAGTAGARSRRVNYSASQLGHQSERIFDALGFFDLCDHTWRVAFIAWAAQCEGDLIEVIETAGWNAELSSEWVKYFSAGLRKLNSFRSRGIRDPLMLLLPYPGSMLVKNSALNPDSDMISP